MIDYCWAENKEPISDNPLALVEISYIPTSSLKHDYEKVP